MNGNYSLIFISLNLKFELFHSVFHFARSSSIVISLA